MWVRSLSAQDFRNFNQITVSLSPGINIIHGDNAQGKTNFLEAIGLCATGRSARVGTDAELIRFGKNEAHVRVEYEKNDSATMLNAYIQTIGLNGKTKKYLSVDKVPVKKWNELLGKLLVVNFSPDDLQLIKAGPAERRLFMDTEISQLSPVYFNELKEYNRALKQRNHLLKEVQKKRAPEEELLVWDEQLNKYGQRIIRFRTAFIHQISPVTQHIHARITGGDEKLWMAYKPNIENIDDYSGILKQNRLRDIAMGSTSSGIHRDDCLFEINGTPARAFGSQGQQRTAALSVKLAEIEIIKETTNHTPVLLLDDVLSELDKHRQRFLIEQIGLMQVIITCTGVEDFLTKTPVHVDTHVNIMHMENGELKK